MVKLINEKTEILRLISGVREAEARASVMVMKGRLDYSYNLRSDSLD